MEKNLSLPVTSISFKLNELTQKIYSLDISNSDRVALQESINEVHDAISKVHNIRRDMVDEIYKIANALWRDA